MYSYYFNQEAEKNNSSASVSGVDSQARFEMIQRADRYANNSLVFFGSALFVCICRLFFDEEFLDDNGGGFLFIETVFYLLGLIYMFVANDIQPKLKRAKLATELYIISGVLIFLAMIAILIF